MSFPQCLTRIYTPFTSQSSSTPLRVIEPPLSIFNYCTSHTLVATQSRQRHLTRTKGGESSLHRYGEFCCFRVRKLGQSGEDPYKELVHVYTSLHPCFNEESRNKRNRLLVFVAFTGSCPLTNLCDNK